MSPQAVVERLNAVLGDAVRASGGADPAEHAGHVDHPPPGLLDERQHAQGHGDHPVQVDVQHELEVVDGQPVVGGGGHGHARVVHHGP